MACRDPSAAASVYSLPALSQGRGVYLQIRELPIRHPAWRCAGVGVGWGCQLPFRFSEIACVTGVDSPGSPGAGGFGVHGIN